MIRVVTAILFFIFLLIEVCSQGYIVNLDKSTPHPEGRSLFLSKCSACHQLYNPHRFTEAVWDSILVPMQAKAKLDAEQRNKIFNWIIEIKNDSNRAVNLK